MATADDRATLRGLLVADPRARDTDALWTDESTLTEAGPYIGVPAPTAATTASAAFAATGSIGASVDVDFQTLDGGGVGGVPVVYRRNGDSTWYGAENPARLTGATAVLFTSLVGSVARNPSMCDLGDGSLLIAYAVDVSGTRSVRARPFDTSTGSFGSEVIIETDLIDPGNGEHPRLVSRREGGSVVAYLAYLHVGDDGLCQVRIYRSTDKGVTWQVHVRGAVGVAGISNYNNRGYPVEAWQPQSLEFAYWRGVFALFVHYNDQGSTDDYRDFTQQWVSRDAVAFDRLDYIETSSSGDARGFPRFIPQGDRFEVQFVMYDTASTFERVISTQRSLLADCVSAAEGNAPSLLSYTAISNIEVAGGQNQAGEYASTRYVERLGAGATQTQGGEYGLVYNGTEQGRGTVEEITTITASSYPVVYPGFFWTSRDQNFYPTDIDVLPCGGSVWAVARLTVPGATTDGSIWLFRMSGFSDVSMGLVGTEPSSGRGFYQTFLGVTRPDNVGWTRAVGGAPTESATSTGWRMQTGVGESLQYTVATTDTLENVTRFIVTDDSTGTTKGIGTARIADGTFQVDVQIRSSATGFTVFDPNGGGLLATISTDMTVGVEIEVYMRHNSTANGGTCSVYYRDHDLALQKSWTAAVTDQALTDAGSPGANGQVGFGCNASADVRFLTFHYGENSGSTIPAGQTNPDDLRPITLSASPATLDAAAAVNIIGGIAAPGVTYRTSNEHTNAIENVVPAHEASPRRSWRSTDTTVHRIALTLDATLDGSSGEESSPFSDLIAVHVAGTNMRNGSIETASAAATPVWTSAYTIDNSITLAYARTGNVIKPSGGSGVYLRLNELAGAWIDLGSGKQRRIVSNTDGVWDSTFAGRQARLVIEDADGTEPASGTGYAVPQAFTVIISTAAAAAGVRLVIDNQSNPDGYHEVGSLLYGPVVVFGLDSSWGNVYETRPNTTMRTSIDGTRRAQKLGPSRRMVELAWTDGTDLTQVDEASPDPDYVTSTDTGGIGAAASVRDWPHQRIGLVDLLDGDVHPVVYLPGFARGTPDARMLNRRHEAVYGRVIGTGRVEVILGDENASEVVRVPGMVVEEEI